MLGSGFSDLAGIALLKEIGFRSEEYSAQAPSTGGRNEDYAAAHFLSHGVLEDDRVAPFAKDLLKVIRVVERSCLSERRKVELLQALTRSRLIEHPTNINFPESPREFLHPTGAYRPLLVFGDSHSAIYGHRPTFLRNGWLTLPFFCWAGSARGLRKEHSQSYNGPKILRILESNREALKRSNAVLVLHFGQVDVEFVFHFKRVAEGDLQFNESEFQRFIAESVDRYIDFAEQIRSLMGYGIPIVISGILPPTWADHSLFKDRELKNVIDNNGDAGWTAHVPQFEALFDGLQALEMPNWYGRTELHRSYNELLERRCSEAGLPFINVFDYFLGPHGLVADDFVAEHAGTEIHLEMRNPAGLLASTLLSERLTAIVLGFTS